MMLKQTNDKDLIQESTTLSSVLSDHKDLIVRIWATRRASAFVIVFGCCGQCKH